MAIADAIHASGDVHYCQNTATWRFGVTHDVSYIMMPGVPDIYSGNIHAHNASFTHDSTMHAPASAPPDCTT